jgi:hypothetical protein
MRLLQMMGFGKLYLGNFARRFPTAPKTSFIERRGKLLDDRYGAAHILNPVYLGDPDCFFTACDDPALQQAWAHEHGVVDADPTRILLAQIEEHRAEIIYNTDPISFPSSFVRKLPGCVKKAIAWRAAPSSTVDLGAYDAVLSNFETLSAAWRARGWRAARFFPSYDPATASYSNNTDRAKDLVFVGSYARSTGHGERLSFLNSIAGTSERHTVDIRLQYRKLGRLADKAPWRWVPVINRLPTNLRKVAGVPVFGRDMYKLLSQAKIVTNPATDIAGEERGNMRCWEALGCGSCMMASTGSYPEGFIPGVNFETYTDDKDLIKKIDSLLKDEPRRLSMAKKGAEMVAQVWSKERQWRDFTELVAAL